MKKIIFLVGLISQFVFLPACTIDSGSGFNSGVFVAASETELKDNRNNNDKRNSSISRCEDSSKCIDACEEVYDEDSDEENDGKIETCGEVRYSLAIQFEDILEILKEPYESNLRNIDDKAFAEFLDVSVKPWVDSVTSVSDSEAKDLLIWIARDSAISGAIVDAYKNLEKEFDRYEGIEELFDDIGSTETTDDKKVKCDRFCDGVSKSLVGSNSDSFFDIMKEDNKNTDAEAIVCTIFDRICVNPAFPGIQEQAKCTDLNTTCP